MLLRSLSILILLLPCTVWATSAYEDKALYFEQQQQWSQARRAWQQALLLQPKNLHARYHLAKLFEKMGRNDEAMQLYRENIRQGRHINSVISLFQLYIHDNQRAKAIQLLKKASKQFRHEAAPWYLLASLAIEDKQLEQARHYFKRALKADPLNGFAYLRFAQFLSTQGEHAQAIRYAKKALRLQKACAPCWRIYANILRSAQQLQASLKAYQLSLAIQPNKHTRQQLIQLLHQLGEHQRAERMQQALQHP